MGMQNVPPDNTQQSSGQQGSWADEDKKKVYLMMDGIRVGSFVDSTTGAIALLTMVNEKPEKNWSLVDRHTYEQIITKKGLQAGSIPTKQAGH